MATAQETVDELLQRLEPMPEVRTRKMFGEYALYFHDKVVALICDNQLFLKMTEAGLRRIDDPVGVPPFPGAKHWLLVPREKWPDRNWMSELLEETATLVPPPKPKKRRVG